MAIFSPRLYQLRTMMEDVVKEDFPFRKRLILFTIE